MQHKVFIGINLPPQVKKRLAQKIEPWVDLPVKWTSEDLFHITVSFIGYVDDEAVEKICQAVRKVAGETPMFDLMLEKITLGPDPSDPQLIWAIGEASEDLKLLQENIAKELDTFVASKKEFRPHITLGRIRKLKWEKLAAKPTIDVSVKFSIPAESVEVFESKLDGGKLTYFPLESCPLS